MKHGATARCRPLRRGVAALPLTLLLMALATAVATTAYAGAPARHVQVGQARLDNGLRIYVYEDHAAPVVSVNLWYRVGSRDEPPGRRGMAHLMEHMMFKGSRQLGPEEHARIIDQVGGVSNAFTAPDATVYWDKVPSSRLELVLQLEAERMANLQLTPEHLRTEREVVKEEYRLGLQNDPIGQAFDRFHRVALAGTPYAWTPHGFMDELDAITIDDLQKFYRTHYTPGNAVLVVAGDTDLATVTRLAQRTFGKLPAAPVPERPPVELPRQPALQQETMPFPIQLPAIIGGYLIPGSASADMEALQTASLILSGGQSSRIYRKLVRESQLAVGAAGLAQPYRDAGLFLAVALFLPGKDPAAVGAALRKEIEGLRDGVSAEELQQAKNQAAAGYAFQLDTMDGVANAIGSAVVLEGGLEKFTEGLQPYLALTEEDIVRVARQYLRPERLTLVQVTPAPAGRP